MFSGPSAWEISNGDGKLKVCLWSKLRSHFCSAKSSHFFIQSWFCGHGEVTGGCHGMDFCVLTLQLCQQLLEHYSWIKLGRIKYRKSSWCCFKLCPWFIFPVCSTQNQALGTTNRLQTLSFTVYKGISYMMRITFGLINYFNFSSLNCVLQYIL